jgi:hypothetical protein
MTTEHSEHGGWPSINRPRDPGFDGTGLTFEDYDFEGSLPRRIKVSDAVNNSCTYLAVWMAIVAPNMQPSGLRFKTFEHDPDLMPQVILVQDAWGNCCGYEAWDPRWPISWYKPLVLDHHRDGAGNDACVTMDPVEEDKG